ncbi:MAG: DNA cytosine methyltransferase [Stellaceae bacterium]
MGDLKAISLYTGAGGLDFGFEAAGCDTVAAVELDHDCCRTISTNRSWRVLEGDIGHIESSEILSAAATAPGEIDLLIGGPPCQPFSKSGYWASGDAKRLLDPRASTIGALLRVLRETRPRAFLMENVEGLGYRGKSEGLELIYKVITDINETTGSKYSPCLSVLNAADFGVPQVRRRLFVVASRDGTPFHFPKTTHASADDAALNDERPRYLTAWDAIGGLPREINEELRMRGRWADLLPTIPEGCNYLWHTERMGGLPLFGWRRRYWSFLLKLAKNRPAWTLQAAPGPAIGPFHWTNRRLSPLEMCRLQTFPPGIEVAGSYPSVQRQLGNAVPSLLAEVLAREVRKQLFRLPLTSAEPVLSCHQARAPRPPPEAVLPVPNRFHALIGRHAAHPGTGKGSGATRRIAAQEVLDFAAQ